MSAIKKLFLIDAFALIFRAYYAMSRRPLINSKGVNVSAISGFINVIYELQRKYTPSHMAIVFDSPGATYRADEFAYYKANRSETPEDIKMSIPIIKQILDAMCLTRLELQGYEADDIIGTIAKEKEKESFEIYMVTPDKDFAQLVSPNIYMFKPPRMGDTYEKIGVEEVKEKWKVKTVAQVIDILGLWGDAVDNIPGIPGIGEKTAKKLIQKYGSIEQLIAHSYALKGKQKENVETYAQQAMDSKKLATIILDVPLNVPTEELCITPPNRKELAQLFAQLEFRTLGKRILGAEFDIAPTQGQLNLFTSSNYEALSQEDVLISKTIDNIDTTPHEYILIDTKQKRSELIETLSKQTQVSFDTETTGLNALDTSLVGFSISYKPHTAYYIPCPEDKIKTKALLNEFAPLFSNSCLTIIGQNIKYDMHVLSIYDTYITAPIYDTMIAHYVLQPDLRHNMNYMAETLLQYKPISIESIIGKKGKNQKSMSDIALNDIVPYASEDADITFQLKKELDKRISKTPALSKVLNDIELPLIPALAQMEQNGVTIDLDFLNQYAQEIHREIDVLKIRIFEQTQRSFNIDSPKQMGEILFDHMGISYKGKKTKTGQYSTKEDVLQKIKTQHPVISDILNYRELTKLQNTYVRALPQLVNKRTGKIHTTFNQAVTATGRLSSVAPNLQNIPIRTDRGRQIRKAFVASNSDYLILAADYSQIELRLIAALSGDKTMLDAFSKGEDIHTTTASKVFNVPLSQVDRQMRSHAKTVNFGIIYGVSAFGLSQQTSLSRKEATDIIQSYFKTYPCIKTYMDENKRFAQKNGYVETLMGRRRYLRDILSKNAVVRGHAERNAINAPIQGSAADIIKLATINLHQILKERRCKTKMTLQVHDELVFEVHKDELSWIRPIIQQEMQTVVNLTVPLLVEIGVGNNWLEAH